jgi:hypothetical protein
MFPKFLSRKGFILSCTDELPDRLWPNPFLGARQTGSDSLVPTTVRHGLELNPKSVCVGRQRVVGHTRTSACCMERAPHQLLQSGGLGRSTHRQRDTLNPKP